MDTGRGDKGLPHGGVISEELGVRSEESAGKPVKARKKSPKKKQKEREEKFFTLVDEVSELLERAMRADEIDTKDLKQITGALKDLKDLIWEKNSKEDDKNEGMTIKIEGDVE